MFFGKKKVKEKKFIDYVLEDIFGLAEMLAISQAADSVNWPMRRTILGPEKCAIENAAITNAIKVSYFLSILSGVAEHSNIDLPENYQLYHAMMIDDAWGSRCEYRDGVKWAVRRGDDNCNIIKMLVKTKFDGLPDHQKHQLLALIETTFPEIVSVAHVGALIELANKVSVKTQ